MHTPGRLGMPAAQDESPRSFANWPSTSTYFYILHDNSQAWTFALLSHIVWALPTCCATRQCEKDDENIDTHITHFNTFPINPFAVRELSAFVQPKLVAHPVRRRQIITHGCFGDFRHDWQSLGFWVGEPKRCAKIFSALYEHASFVKVCHYTRVLKVVGLPMPIPNGIAQACRKHAWVCACLMRPMERWIRRVFFWVQFQRIMKWIPMERYVPNQDYSDEITVERCITPSSNKPLHQCPNPTAGSFLRTSNCTSTSTTTADTPTTTSTTSKIPTSSSSSS